MTHPTNYQIPLLPARSSNPIRVFSYGGGVQSFTTLALQAHGRLPRPYDVFIFANVGNDSENPDTLEHMHNVAIPFAEQHQIPLVITQKKLRDGSEDTLLKFIQRTKRSVPIPAYMQNGAPGNRSCTAEFKIKVVDKWLKTHEYTHATIGLGFSTDEARRAVGKPQDWVNQYNKRPIGFWKRFEFPLMQMFLNRAQCHNILRGFHLPIPPKSACWFCPFTSRGELIERKKHNPALVQNAAILESIINRKRNAIGRDRVYLHRDTVPFLNAIPDQISMLDVFADDLDCGTGYCGL